MYDLIIKNYWMRFIIKVSVISQSLRSRLITLNKTLIIVDITKTESHNNYTLF